MMNHLSENELFEYVDGRATGLASTLAEEHCARCAQCRQRADFHRMLRVSAGEPRSGLLPVDFTERVMQAAARPARAPRFSWLLHNSGNIVAMVVVFGILTVVGYYTSQSSGEPTSEYLRMLSFWKDASSFVLSDAARQTARTLAPVVTETGKVFGDIFWMGAAALVLLGLADRIVLRTKINRALR